MAVLKCPNCGANNLDTGAGVRCEYCNSYLETKIKETITKPENTAKPSYTFNMPKIPIPDITKIPIVGRFFTETTHTAPVNQPKVKDYNNSETVDNNKKYKNKKSIISIIIIVFIFAGIASALFNAFFWDRTRDASYGDLAIKGAYFYVDTDYMGVSNKIIVTIEIDNISGDTCKTDLVYELEFYNSVNAKMETKEYSFSKNLSYGIHSIQHIIYENRTLTPVFISAKIDYRH